MSAHAEHAVPMPHEWPEDAHFGRATSAKVGMWVFLLSDALMFAGFLLAYGILRGGHEGAWPPEGQPVLGIPFTAVLTFLLICSSVTMVLSHAALIEKNFKQSRLFLGLTILGGVLFLAGQVYEYFGRILFLIPTHGGLINHGLIFGEDAYANTFYLITSFHGFHVFSGVVYLSVIWVRLFLGKYDDGNYNHLEVAGLFWHFVDLVWILVFTLVYLL